MCYIALLMTKNIKMDKTHFFLNLPQFFFLIQKSKISIVSKGRNLIFTYTEKYGTTLESRLFCITKMRIMQNKF